MSDFPFDTLARSEIAAPAVIIPAYREITLGRNGDHVALVSEEDFHFLIQWRWNFKVSRGGGVYARRGGGYEPSGGFRPTILMHNVIMERRGIIRPSDVHTVHHKDRNSLNNQRGNLKWATPAQQVKWR